MNQNSNPGITRRHLLCSVATAAGIGTVAGISGSLWWASNSTTFQSFLQDRRHETLQALARLVVPTEGVTTDISFGDSIQRLVSAGVVSPEKFRAVYARRGGLPDWIESLFVSPSNEPIVLSLTNAPYLLNLLWPLGLATRTPFNARSPLNGVDRARFASTGGWVLGEAARGGDYFNRVSAIELDKKQSDIVLAAAEKSFRPCCNNSTFFQDCNHGSALLGLYELAAARGASIEQLFALGKIANSYWYPDKYFETAIYFSQVKETPWDQLDPAVVMSAEYSSINGWNQNIHTALANRGLIPQQASPSGGTGCSA